MIKTNRRWAGGGNARRGGRSGPTGQRQQHMAMAAAAEHPSNDNINYLFSTSAHGRGRGRGNAAVQQQTETTAGGQQQQPQIIGRGRGRGGGNGVVQQQQQSVVATAGEMVNVQLTTGGRGGRGRGTVVAQAQQLATVGANGEKQSIAVTALPPPRGQRGNHYDMKCAALGPPRSIYTPRPFTDSGKPPTPPTERISSEVRCAEWVATSIAMLEPQQQQLQQAMTPSHNGPMMMGIVENAAEGFHAGCSACVIKDTYMKNMNHMFDHMKALGEFYTSQLAAARHTHQQ